MSSNKMMPTYEDVGKGCKEFFDKGYFLNSLKLSAKRSLIDCVEWAKSLTWKAEDGTAKSDCELKYKYPQWGALLSTKLDSASLLSWKAETADKLADGLKITVDGTLNMDTAVKSAKLNTQYRHALYGTVDLGVNGGDEDNMTLNGALVSGYSGFLGGTQLGYDLNEGALKKYNIVLGYCGGPFMVHANLDNAETVAAIAHYKFNDTTEFGLNGTYTNGDDSKTRYGIGAKFLFGRCAAFKCKIDNTKTITMACEMKATDAATLTVCGMCNAADGTGQIGAGVEFAG